MKKKCLSVFLAALMLLSACSVGLVAFAADTQEPNLKEIASVLESVAREDAESESEGQTQALKDALGQALKFGAAATQEVLNSLTQSDASAQAQNGTASDVADAKTLFLAAMDAVTEPYDNADIAAVKPLYSQLTLKEKNALPQEVKDKYKAILAAVGPDVPLANTPDLSVYRPTVVTYPTKLSTKQVEKSLPKTEGFLVNFLPKLLQKDNFAAMTTGQLYANQTVADLCKALYPALENLVSLLKVEPKALADQLTEEKFAGVVSDLLTAQQLGDIQKEEGMTPDYWGAFTVTNGSFGFTDGDREGFLDAVAAIFRPLSYITVLLPFENTADTKKGTYTYGAYEELLPIFELLDLQDVLSSHDYTLRVQEAAAVSKNAAMDARIRPILVPIANLLDAFAKNPVQVLLNILPKVTYAIDSGCLQTQVESLLKKVRLISIPAPDLSTNGLYQLIAPALKDIDANGIHLSFLLHPERFAQYVRELAGCGDAVSKPSIARGQQYRLGIDSDKNDAFVVLFRFLYGELVNENNLQALQGAVDSNTSLSAIERSVANQVLRQLRKTSADDALITYVSIISPNPLPLSLLGILQDVLQKLFQGAGEITKGFGSLLGSIFGGFVDSSTPDIPQTSRSGGAALLVFSLVTIGTLGLLIVKKKKSNQ